LVAEAVQTEDATFQGKINLENRQGTLATELAQRLCTMTSYLRVFCHLYAGTLQVSI